MLMQMSSGHPPSVPSHPAGWYADPWGRAAQRWWDGNQWTEHQAGPVAPPAPAAAPTAPVVPPPAQAAAVAPAAPQQPAPLQQERSQSEIPRFGARGKARELATEVETLREEVARLGRLGVMPAAELEQHREQLERDIADQRSRLESDRIALGTQMEQVRAQLHDLRREVVATADEAVLQEVGVYEYRHPLSDAVAYQAELARLKDAIKTMARNDGGAVTATTSWQVNGSLPQGRAMVRDISKLILRAYNAEADNLVRALKPYKLTSSVDRLTKVAVTISKLGRAMDIEISEPYHQLRVRELELTADYLEFQAQQKEREREEKERLREERRAQQEMEREKARLEKERKHYTNALAALRAKGDEEAASRLQEQLSEIEHKIEAVDYRAANIRAGYVYVISNVGSFGETIVKVGMTRRLEPLDRVRELGDASVPFRFDVHALFFSDDAVGIENSLHQRLADRRVNRVNLRREFFYATPQEVKTHLIDLAGELVEYEEFPEALEYRQTLSQTDGSPTAVG